MVTNKEVLGVLSGHGKFLEHIYIYIYIYIKRDIREIYKREIIIRIVKDRMLRHFWHIV